MTVENAHTILIADPIDESGIEVLRVSAQVDVMEAITREELLSKIGAYDAIIVRGRTKVTDEVVQAGSQLRVVGRAGVGVDNVDLDACRRHGVTVVNSPLGAGIAVAELTLALMLGLARRVPYADMEMKRGQWSKNEIKGIELHGNILGLIAVGRIGSEVAHRATSLGMQVIGYDPRKSEHEMRARGVELATLEQVLRDSDYISIHTPLTDETRHMIGRDSIALMKDGVRIVCAARGGVIDEQALFDGLQSGKVAGAALDVFEIEPPGLSALVRHPNVIATPHIGSQTREAQVRSGIDIALEVLAALCGEDLRWRVV